MAWPRTSTSAWEKPSGSPAAIRICVVTRSSPVSISVTGCSTWIRQLISMKKKSPSRVDQELEGADVLVAGGDGGPDRPLRELGARGRRRGPASAPPRGSSGGAAGPSSRARPGGRRGRSGRRRPGPRRGGSRRATSRGRASRRRTRPCASERQTRSDRLELARRADHAHALAAAAGRWLDEDRVADPLGLAQRVHLVAQHPVRARDRRQAVGRRAAGASPALLANRSRTAADGPMNVRPWAATTSAKPSSSDRKP